MAEKIILTLPIAVKPGYADLTVAVFNQTYRVGRYRIHVELDSGPDANVFSWDYEDDDARDRMRAFNKANLATKSGHKRILEALIAEHPELAGSITGTPD